MAAPRGFLSLLRLAGRTMAGNAELLTAEEKLAIQEGRMTMRQAQNVNQVRNLHVQIGTGTVGEALAGHGVLVHTGVTHELVAAFHNMQEAILHVETAINGISSQTTALTSAASELHQLNTNITAWLQNPQANTANELITRLDTWLQNHEHDVGGRIIQQYGFDSHEDTWFQTYKRDLRELVGIALGVIKPDPAAT